MQQSNKWDSSSQRSNNRVSFRPSTQLYNTSSQKKQMGYQSRINEEDAFYSSSNNQTRPKSQKTSQLLSSEGSSYIPSIARNSSKPTQGEYSKDSEEGIEDMKKFLKENRKLLEKCKRRIDSPNREEITKQYQNSCLWSTILLGLLFLCLFCYIFLGGKKTDVQNKIQAFSNNCWQKFKSQKCDLNNPLGHLCRQLYDCYLKEKNERQSKQEAGQSNSAKKDDSLIEQFLISSLAGVIGYFVGMERIQRGLGILWRLIEQIVKIVQQIHRNRQNGRIQVQ